MVPAAPAPQTVEEQRLPRGVARTRRLTGFRIVGAGSYVPEPVVTNEDLQHLGFDSEWIRQRTGILERRHAPEEMATSDLCHEAATRCLANSGVAAADVDLLVVATFTPDMALPSVASMLQHRMGLHCGAFDLSAACAGFMYALAVGAQFVATGNSRRCLVVGGDCNSRIVNPNDFKTYPLFGDGAGAVLLAPGAAEQGLLSYQLGSDGSGGDLLCRPAGGSKMPISPAAIAQDLQYMHMDGRAVFKWAVNTVTDSTQEVLKHAGVAVSEVALFVPHQANLRIINAVSDVLGFPRDRVFNNLDRYGNTSCGSIPLCLDEALAAQRIRPGDKVLMTGFGAGLTWATGLLAW